MENPLFKIGRADLVLRCREGDKAAAQELLRRGRDPQTGLKTGGLGSRIGKAVSNPSLRTSRQRKKTMRGVKVFHADHGITQKQKEFILSELRATAPQGFFVKQVNIPKRLGSVPNALYGPDAGDPPVREEQVYYTSRGGRPVEDRLVHAAPRPWQYVQTIGIRVGDDFTIFTIYGGPLAPMHPDDPNNRDPEGSRKWWSQHALADGQWAAAAR